MCGTKDPTIECTSFRCTAINAFFTLGEPSNNRLPKTCARAHSNFNTALFRFHFYYFFLNLYVIVLCLELRICPALPLFTFLELRQLAISTSRFQFVSIVLVEFLQSTWWRKCLRLYIVKAFWLKDFASAKFAKDFVYDPNADKICIHIPFVQSQCIKPEFISSLRSYRMMTSYAHIKKYGTRKWQYQLLLLMIEVPSLKKQRCRSTKRVHTSNMNGNRPLGKSKIMSIANRDFRNPLVCRFFFFTIKKKIVSLPYVLTDIYTVLWRRNRHANPSVRALHNSSCLQNNDTQQMRPYIAVLLVRFIPYAITNSVDNVISPTASPPVYTHTLVRLYAISLNLDSHDALDPIRALHLLWNSVAQRWRGRKDFLPVVRPSALCTLFSKSSQSIDVHIYTVGQKIGALCLRSNKSISSLCIHYCVCVCIFVISGKK